MSEKRFKKGDNLSCVDTETKKSYYYPCNLVGLLNEQQNTISNLRKWVQAEQKQVEKRDAFIKEKGLMREYIARECKGEKDE